MSDNKAKAVEAKVPLCCLSLYLFGFFFLVVAIFFGVNGRGMFWRRVCPYLANNSSVWCGEPLLEQNRGNTFFAAGKHVEAIASFTQAIEFDNSDPVFFSNRSASFCAVGKYTEAIADANMCLKLKADWAKGTFWLRF